MAVIDHRKSMFFSSAQEHSKLKTILLTFMLYGWLLFVQRQLDSSHKQSSSAPGILVSYVYY